MRGQYSHHVIRSLDQSEAILILLTRYPCLVSALVNMVQSEDSSIKIVAFETIGYIGVSLGQSEAIIEVT